MHEQQHAAMRSGNPLRFSLRTLFFTVTLVGLLLSAVVWLADILSGIVPISSVEPKPFDEKQWKAWSINDMRQSDHIRRSMARRDMLDDLLARHDLTGWTEPKLAKLLGSSNPDFCPDDRDLAYLLGLG